MNLLVTGGCGFIGSNFIKYMLEKDYLTQITNVDKLTHAGEGKNLEHMGVDQNFRFRYYFIKGDVADSELVNGILRDYSIDGIVNFAAESHVDRSIEDASPFVDSNVKGTQVLLDAARKYEIEKFIQIGTDEVYGSLGKKDDSSKETDVLEPSSPYSSSKAAADLLALSYFKTHDLPVCVTRSCNNFGPYQHPEKVIPLFVTNILEEKKVPLYGGGGNVREWIYVKENCEAIERVLKAGKAGEIYNIGSGYELTNLELTNKILKFMNKDGSFIEPVEDRKGHDLKYSLDRNKMRELGWQSDSSFTAKLIETLIWYRKNENWWKPLKKKNGK